MDASLSGRVSHHTHGLARAFARTGIGLCALATNWQPAQMADPTVAFDTLQAFEIHTNFPAQIAFDDVFAILDRVHDLR